jgi:hypothetical protein
VQSGFGITIKKEIPKLPISTGQGTCHTQDPTKRGSNCDISPGMRQKKIPTIIARIISSQVVVFL